VIIEVINENENEQTYNLKFGNINNRIENHSLTFEVTVPTSWCQSPVFLIDDIECLAEVVRPNTLRCTVEISNETRLHFGKK
jgi:hypothetical protein